MTGSLLLDKDGQRPVGDFRYQICIGYACDPRKEGGRISPIPRVVNRNRLPFSTNDAAFCSREGGDTVVNSISPSCSFGLFGLSGLFGLGLNETNQINQKTR